MSRVSYSSNENPEEIFFEKFSKQKMVLGVWMTFKKTEMAKTLRNGLSMIETNLLNHNWLDFAIQLGLALHQFQKKPAVKA